MGGVFLPSGAGIKIATLFMIKPTYAEADYFHVRSSNVCPLCGEHKETGLVACWSCYRSYNLRYGNPEAELLLDEAEIRLKQKPPLK